MKAPFQEEEALADIFGHIKDVDDQMFGVILEKLRNEKVQDIIGYFSDNWNQSQLEQCIIKKGVDITQADKEQKLSVVRNDIKQIIKVLRKLKDHDFNKLDYSSEVKEESKQSLINSIQDNRRIIHFLQLLVQLTSIDETFIQGGSNSLHILVKMKVDLRNNNFENIKIYNTSLIGANFVSGINVNGALLLNCKWTDLKILELNQLHSHNDYIRSVCFSPDGNTLASGGSDCSIRLWDVKTGQQKAKLERITSNISSVCFSPDGNTLASGSDNGSVLLWNLIILFFQIYNRKVII
ncbi:unnamed protein product [Paramecium primaurelia]|uniref:Uncharacterized protein n=1 Tax=Paramecium primaurelia TaxID=5886 RepID=A0A8S1NB51_PARPR|nr:unnamed protein product [Paramecium primaurelia]